MNNVQGRTSNFLFLKIVSGRVALHFAVWLVQETMTWSR